MSHSDLLARLRRQYGLFKSITLILHYNQDDVNMQE